MKTFFSTVRPRVCWVSCPTFTPPPPPHALLFNTYIRANDDEDDDDDDHDEFTKTTTTKKTNIDPSCENCGLESASLTHVWSCPRL